MKTAAARWGNGPSAPIPCCGIGTYGAIALLLLMGKRYYHNRCIYRNLIAVNNFYRQLVCILSLEQFKRQRLFPSHFWPAAMGRTPPLPDSNQGRLGYPSLPNCRNSGHAPARRAAGFSRLPRRRRKASAARHFGLDAAPPAHRNHSKRGWCAAAGPIPNHYQFRIPELGVPRRCIGRIAGHGRCRRAGETSGNWPPKTALSGAERFQVALRAETPMLMEQAAARARQRRSGLDHGAAGVRRRAQGTDGTVG